MPHCDGTAAGFTSAYTPRVRRQPYGVLRTAEKCERRSPVICKAFENMLTMLPSDQSQTRPLRGVSI